MYEIDLNVRDVNGSSITTDEEFREALEKGFDRFSALDIYDELKIREETPDFSKAECLSYLAENFDFSDEVDSYCKLIDEIESDLEKIKNKKAIELMEKVQKLRDMIYSISIID